MMKKRFDFVFCCLSQEQQEMVYTAAENHDPRAVYDAQRNLLREKHGYRCSICGKFYPYIELDYRETRIDPRKYAKVAGTLRKGRKAAVVFDGQYYCDNNPEIYVSREELGGRSIAEALLEPTKIYVKTIKHLLNNNVKYYRNN